MMDQDEELVALRRAAEARASACKPGCRYYGARLHPENCAPAWTGEPPAESGAHSCGRFVFVGRLRDLAMAGTFREVPPASPLAALKGATERMEKVAAATPAEMLGEAYALLERARVLALDAYDKMADTPLSRTNGVVLFGDTRRWVEWLKREAEALE